MPDKFQQSSSNSGWGLSSVLRQSRVLPLCNRDRYAQCQTVPVWTGIDMPVVVLVMVVDNPVMAQRTFSLVPCSRPQRFPSWSLLIRRSSWLCRSCSSGTRREETVEIQQLQPVFSWTRSFTRPSCATTDAWSMFWRSSSTVLTSL